MSEIEQSKKYVIQLEHENALHEQGENLVYMIKDKALTQRVDAIDKLLRYYKGLAGTDVDGTLTSDWLNNTTTLKSGLYLVTDCDTTTINIDNQNNTNGIYTQWLTSDDSMQDYLNYNNNIVTGIREIQVPAILLVNVDKQNGIAATMIDSNGIIWRQQSYITDNTANYYWVNIFDDKANIQDFIALLEKVIKQEEEIASLKDDLKNLQDEIEQIKAAQQFETLLVEGADPTIDNVINVLVIGNNMDFGTNMSDLIQSYLSLKGTVVWIKNASTKDALSYFQPATDNEGDVILPTLSSTDSNVVFSSNKVNGNTITSLNVKEFDIIIFIINKNDLDSTTTYGSVASSGALSGTIGDYVISDNIKVTVAGEPHWILNSEGQKIGVASVPVIISYNTISGAIQTLIKSIHSRLPKASLEVATPITWQKNSTYTMTTSDNQLVSSLISAVTNICKNMSTTYNNTYQITAENKSYLDANDNTIKYNDNPDTKNAVDKYIKDLCEIIKKYMPTASASFKVSSLKDTSFKGSTVALNQIHGTGSKTFIMPEAGSCLVTYNSYYVSTRIDTSDELLTWNQPSIALRVYRIRNNISTLLIDNNNSTLIDRPANNTSNVTIQGFQKSTISRALSWEANDSIKFEIATQSGTQDVLGKIRVTCLWDINLLDNTENVEEGDNMSHETN